MPRQKSQHVDDPAAVGQRLKEARERAGLSQRELSSAGCSPGYVSRLEAGQRIPSLQLLRELARRLGVSVEYLATGALTPAHAESPLVDAEIALRFDDLATARALYERALEGDGHARALEGLGHVALREARFRDAIECFEEARAALPDGLVEQIALVEALGRAYGAVGELAPAIALFEEAVRGFELSEDHVQYVRFASLLGSALTDCGDYQGAERVLARALDRGHDLTDPHSRARLYWSQSRLLAERGEAGPAERYARRTLEILRATDDGYAVAHALQSLAHICLELDRPREALALLDEGSTLIAATGTPADVAHYRLEEARALLALGDREQAGALAMRLAGQLRDLQPVLGGRAYLVLAEVFEQLDERERAKELYELAIERTEPRAPNRVLLTAYRRLADLLKEEGRRDEALELLEHALGLQAGKPERQRSRS